MRFKPSIAATLGRRDARKLSWRIIVENIAREAALSSLVVTSARQLLPSSHIVHVCCVVFASTTQEIRESRSMTRQRVASLLLSRPSLSIVSIVERNADGQTYSIRCPSNMLKSASASISRLLYIPATVSSRRSASLRAASFRLLDILVCWLGCLCCRRSPSTACRISSL